MQRQALGGRPACVQAGLPFLSVQNRSRLGSNACCDLCHVVGHVACTQGPPAAAAQGHLRGAWPHGLPQGRPGSEGPAKHGAGGLVPADPRIPGGDVGDRAPGHLTTLTPSHALCLEIQQQVTVELMHYRTKEGLQ